VATENIRDFIIRTLLRDEGGEKGLDRLLAKATALTAKSYTMTVAVATKEAEKAIKSVEKATKAAGEIDTSKATKGIKEQDKALGGMNDKLRAMADQSKKAGDTVGSFFQKLDAGKLIVAGAAAGMVAYAKSALQVAEAQRLNIAMIRDQLGSQAGGVLNFISKGDQGFGTSSLTRGNLAGYMAMTGYRDQSVIQKNIKNAERIMSSTFGQSLAGFGITDEKGLLQTLSNPLDENSDIGRIVKSKMPEFFKAGTLQTEKLKVQREKSFAYQSDEVVEAEARRRLASKALERIGEQVEPDTDSYRVGMRDLTRSFEKLNEGIGNAIRPAATIIMGFTTAVVKLLALVPEVPALIAVVLGLGTAFAVLPTILGLVTGGITALTASLLANPIGLAIVAIVALAVVLSSLESRFQVFSKAWDHFAKSEIGKDLINGLNSLLASFGILGEGDYFSGVGKAIETVSGYVAGLFDQVDALYKLWKSGDIGGALKGGIGLAIKLSPMGLVAGFAEALLPSKRVQDMILYVLQKMKDLWDGFTNWLRDIHGAIVDKLAPLVKIYEYLKQIVDKFTGGGQKPLTEDAKWKLVDWVKSLDDSKGRDKYDFGNATILAAIEEAQTGKPMRPEGANEKKYNDMVDALRNKLANPNAGDKDVSPLGAASGNPFYNPAYTNDIKGPGGLDIRTKPSDQIKGSADVEGGLQLYGRMAYDYIFRNKNAVGGEVQRSGLAWVDEGEPIVPAEVARSSVLINSLKDIAAGGSGGGNITVQIGDIHVAPTGGADGYSIARQIREGLEKELSSFEFKSKVEAAVGRANRAYIA